MTTWFNPASLTTNPDCGLNDLGDLGLILVTLSALKVESRPLFLFLLYSVVVVMGVRAYTKAWNDVTVNTPIRPRTPFVPLDTYVSKVWNRYKQV